MTVNTLRLCHQRWQSKKNEKQDLESKREQIGFMQFATMSPRSKFSQVFMQLTRCHKCFASWIQCRRRRRKASGWEALHCVRPYLANTKLLMANKRWVALSCCVTAPRLHKGQALCLHAAVWHSVLHTATECTVCGPAAAAPPLHSLPAPCSQQSLMPGTLWKH